MFEHNTFVFIFRSKKKVLAKAEDNFEDNFDGAFPFDSLFEQLVCFNKVLFILGTSQKGTILWALYDGIRIVNWYISRTAGSNLNSKKAPIRSMTFYSISKTSEVT